MLATASRSSGAWSACTRSLLQCMRPAAYAACSSGALAGAAASHSTAAAAAAAAALSAAWQQRFDGISPGSLLRIELDQAAADVAITVGEHEAIELTGSSAAVTASAAPHAAHAGASIVTVGLPSGAAAPAEPLQLRARGPSRFLTIEASTAGGSAHVEVVQEGSLRLSTQGGAISVPKVKAADAHLDSGGGAISGAVTGADVRLRSWGGDVSLKSLVGKRVLLDSCGGAVTLGACYADDLHLASGGGPVHVTNMDCREGRAVLSSGGGAVAVDSLDGRCDVDSAGGDVQIQLHDNAGAVSVRSGGGGITLFLSPGTVGRLRLYNCARVAGRPGLVRLAQPQDDGSLELQLPLGASAAAAAAAAAGHAPPQQQAAQPMSRLQRASQGAPPPPGNAVTSASRGGPAGADIVLDAGGSGTITVSERSWMDALRHKYR